VNLRIVPLAGLFVVVALSACTDDDAASSTTSAPATPVFSEPTASTITTSLTTAAPPTIAEPSTTVAPTMTTDSSAATRAAVAAAIVQNRQDYEYALQNYDAPDALDVVARTTAANSPSWDLTLKNMGTLRTNGWKSTPNPTVPSVAIVEGDAELLDGPPATRAQVTICTIDSDIVIEPGGAPDGSDTVVNDEVVARRTRVTMVLEEGAWKAYEGTGLGSWTGQATCPTV
jgi:hypothetical protein